MTAKLYRKIIIYIFFLIYLTLGLFIYKDFGLGIEEHFQRLNGFYWLKNLFSFTTFDDFKNLINLKYQKILIADPDLPDPNFFNFYGIIFDLPLALIETLFKIESGKIYFELRHLIIFLLFFIGSINFFKILDKRFKNDYVIFLGTIFYICSPRIFGDSFYNNKDILFLSLITISINFLFNYFEKKDFKNLIFFCFFAALSSYSRIMGIYLPLLLIIFYFLEFLVKKYTFKEFIFESSKVFLIFIFFLYLHYPYIWKLNIFEFFDWFRSFFYWMDIDILFNNKYYSIKYLPRSYLPVWILISTPLIITLFFFICSFVSGKLILKRILDINENKINRLGDLWYSVEEKKDLFIFVSFFSFLFYAILLNVAMLSGWRHFYFLHLFIIYFSSLGLNHLFNKLNVKKNKLLFVLGFIFVFLHLIYTNYKFHPYQSLFFSSLIKNDNIKNFQFDSPSLSRSEALKFIAKIEKNNNNKVFVANSSWTPLYNGKDILIDEIKNKFVFTGQEYDEADYIYTNYIYKSDEKYNKNFKIPKNFIKLRDFKKNNILIYSIYKKK